ncbi:MAG: hypothetical protein ABIP03_02020 [Aquihabitans sp.]
MADEDIAFVHEFTVTSATGKQAARALLGFAFGRRQLHKVFGILTIVVALLIYFFFSKDGLTTSLRLFEAAFWAVAFTLAVALGVAALTYFANRWAFTKNALPGSVIRTGFGRDEFVTSNEFSSSRVSYRAVRSIDLRGGFVLIRYMGSSALRVYPSELFPAAALERVRAGAHQG